METYDPLAAPDPVLWLELDEQERLALVEEHHDSAGVELDKSTLHAVMHTVVENQLALRDERVMQTLERLMAEGLDRHDALHAVGSVLAEHVFGILSGGTKESASTNKYYRALEELTAASWRSNT
jgi:hypothetical protein